MQGRQATVSIASQSIDVADVIDKGRLSSFQKWTLALCGLVALLDGVDTFSIGVAASSIAAKLQIPLSSFGPVFSAATLGATVGAFAFGPLADRFGRKSMLIIATLLFSVFTFATALANSFESLIALRFLAGVGLGGATPCFLALASEYAPRRIRASIISALWASFPLGGMIGGFLNSYLIGAYGWQSLFYVGGVVPFIVAILVAIFVPESIRYLISHNAPSARVAGILDRLAPGIASPGATFVSREKALPGAPVKHLFSEQRALSTVLLWVPFFLAFGVLTIVVLWVPALLRQNGMAASDTAIVVAFHGLGAFIGMAIAGRLLERFGAAMALAPAFLIGAVFTAALGSVGTSVVLASVFDGLVGLFVGIGASGMIALSSLVYPTAIRSTGIGWAMGMGRLGQVFSPLATGAMLQAGWTIDRMFLIIAIAPVLAAIVVPLIKLARGASPATKANRIAQEALG
jgi:MFS transporter, AAHS family, 4-hydroxybenzoate transporter